jgi:hypothetical protein
MRISAIRDPMLENDEVDDLEDHECDDAPEANLTGGKPADPAVKHAKPELKWKRQQEDNQMA